MIKTQALYDLYNESNKREREYRLKLIEQQKQKIEEYLPKVDEVKGILSMYLKYSDVLNGKVRELPKTVMDIATTKEKYANLVLRNYYDLYQPKKVLVEEVKALTKETLNYSVYRHILRTFNEEVSKYLADTGKAFEDPVFGAIKVKYKENVVGMINWGESNRNKEILLARGLRPYKKEEAQEAEAKGEVYDGIKWLVPGYKDGMLMVKWSLSPVIKEYFGEDMKFVKYYPARGKYGIVNFLSTHYTKGEHVDFTKYEPITPSYNKAQQE